MSLELAGLFFVVNVCFLCGPEPDMQCEPTQIAFHTMKILNLMNSSFVSLLIVSPRVLLVFLLVDSDIRLRVYSNGWNLFQIHSQALAVVVCVFN